MNPLFKASLLILLSTMTAAGASASSGRSVAEIQQKMNSDDDAAWFCMDCAEKKVEFVGDVVITRAFLFDGGTTAENMVMNGNITVRDMPSMQLVMVSDMTINGNVIVEGNARVSFKGCIINGEVRTNSKNVQYSDTTVGGQKKKDDFEVPEL